MSSWHCERVGPTSRTDRAGAAVKLRPKISNCLELLFIINIIIIGSLHLQPSPLSSEHREAFRRVFRSMRAKPNSHRENALKWRWGEKKKMATKKEEAESSLCNERSKKDWSQDRKWSRVCVGRSSDSVSIFWWSPCWFYQNPPTIPMYRHDDSVWDICLISHV